MSRRALRPRVPAVRVFLPSEGLGDPEWSGVLRVEHAPGDVGVQGVTGVPLAQGVDMANRVGTVLGNPAVPT